MRIRTISPNFWEDEKVGRISQGARLSFIWAWGAADDYGRLRFTPAALRAGAFKFDDMTIRQAESVAEEMQHQGLIVVYEACGEHFAWIPNFQKYQKISTPTASRLPPPPPEYVKIRESQNHYTKTHQVLLPISESAKTAQISMCPEVIETTPQNFPKNSEKITPFFMGLSDQMGIEHPPLPPQGDGECSKPKTPVCPYEKIQAEYNRLFVPLGRPRTTKIGATLRKLMAERWKRDCEGDTQEERWAVMAAYLARAAHSRALTGRKPGFTWEGANLMWLLGPNNWAKVENGAYDDGGGLFTNEVKAASKPPDKPPIEPLSLLPCSMDWQAASALLKDRMSPDLYEKWIAELEYIGDQPDEGRTTVVLQAPDMYSAKHIQDNFQEAIKGALWDCGHVGVAICFYAKPSA